MIVSSHDVFMLKVSKLLDVLLYITVVAICAICVSEFSLFPNILLNIT